MMINTPSGAKSKAKQTEVTKLSQTALLFSCSDMEKQGGYLTTEWFTMVADKLEMVYIED